jgi:hypothetical protein
LKLIIASLIVFSLVILFLFALFPSDISVSRIIQIRNTPERVYKKIADLREWKSWNEFLFETYAANSQAGYGQGRNDSNYLDRINVQVELLKALPDTVITRFRHSNQSFTGNFIMTEMNGQTILEWTLVFHIKWYPWDKLASMFYEKQLGPVMEKSLLHLQKELETPGN